MSTTPQTRPTARRLVAVIVSAGANVGVTYITEARATALYMAGEPALTERNGEFVYALRGAEVGR